MKSHSTLSIKNMKGLAIIGVSLLSIKLFADWEVQFENTTYGFYGVSFVDTLHGWVVGGGLSYGPGVILKTKDGGVSWDWTYTDHRLNGVCFMDTLWGWIVGDSGTIIHTENGGENWILQESETICNLCGVKFIDTLNGWAVGDSAIILHTSNGGKNWKIQNQPESPFWLLAVDFIDKNTGWAVGAPSQIYYTINGGDTWETQDPGIGAFAMQDIQFLDSLDGWIAAYGSVYRSVDGGSTWVCMSSNFCADGLCFIDRGIGWVVGDYDISNTCDAGSTWITEMSPGLAWVVRVIFVDTTHGWAVGYYPLVANEARGEILHYSSPHGIEEETNFKPASFTIFPNPVCNDALITFYTVKTSHVCLRVYDSLGRLVNTLVDGYASGGKQQVTWQPQVGSGVYFLKFEGGSQTIVKKVAVLNSHIKRR